MGSNWHDNEQPFISYLCSWLLFIWVRPFKIEKENPSSLTISSLMLLFVSRVQNQDYLTDSTWFIRGCLIQRLLPEIALVSTKWGVGISSTSSRHAAPFVVGAAVRVPSGLPLQLASVQILGWGRYSSSSVDSERQRWVLQSLFGDGLHI